MTNAWIELTEEFEPDEKLEAIVFGAWGWGSIKNPPELGYCEPNPPPIPFEHRGVLLNPEQAKPLMQTWCIKGGFGAPECYAMRAWTNKRIFWITQYDGATYLNSSQRNPFAHIPDMPGG